MDEGDWKRLLKQVRGGYVVPVLGAQLLADRQGNSVLQRRVAEIVLETYKVPLADVALAPFRELNAAVSHLISKGVGAQKLYIEVSEAIEVCARDDGLVPEAVRELAQITDFRLFVTMTPDDTLARCLRQQRRRSPIEVIHSPRMPGDEWQDLREDWARSGGNDAWVLYMLGKASAAPVFAMHDEDVLEYAHNLMTRGSNVPVRFLAALQERSLLMLGCGLPDWLGRFFLRLTKKGRLSEGSRNEWLIEPERAGNDELAHFLSCFSASTDFRGVASPLDFVKELLERWKRDRDAAGTQHVEPLRDPPPPRAAGTIFFVSYSRDTDRERAGGVVSALLELGATEDEIWFDRASIAPGDEFPREIAQGIERCEYFLPLLSRSALSRDKAYVFAEWRAAEKRRPMYSRPFLLPLVVDSDPEPASDFFTGAAADWHEINLGFAPEGKPDVDTIDTLRSMLRAARQRRSPR